MDHSGGDAAEALLGGGESGDGGEVLGHSALKSTLRTRGPKDLAEMGQSCAAQVDGDLSPVFIDQQSVAS